MGRYIKTKIKRFRIVLLIPWNTTNLRIENIYILGQINIVYDYIPSVLT